MNELYSEEKGRFNISTLKTLSACVLKVYLVLEDSLVRGRIDESLRRCTRGVPKHCILLRLYCQIALRSAGSVATSFGTRQYQRSRPVRLIMFSDWSQITSYKTYVLERSTSHFFWREMHREKWKAFPLSIIYVEKSRTSVYFENEMNPFENIESN
jgi:hypothetical protein